jgi:hypothetical protein
VAQTEKLNRGAASFAVAKAKVSFATQKPAAVFRDDTSEDKTNPSANFS